MRFLVCLILMGLLTAQDLHDSLSQPPKAKTPFRLYYEDIDNYTKLNLRGNVLVQFRVDTDGDMWICHATQGSAPFQVTKGGAITASSGSIGGISINSCDIQSSNYSSN